MESFTEYYINTLPCFPLTRKGFQDKSRGTERERYKQLKILIELLKLITIHKIFFFCTIKNIHSGRNSKYRPGKKSAFKIEMLFEIATAYWPDLKSHSFTPPTIQPHKISRLGMPLPHWLQIVGTLAFMYWYIHI